MRRFFGRRFLSASDLIPTRAPEGIIHGLSRRRAGRLPPKDALKFTLRLDKTLYDLVGAPSIAYGNGAHTKHRRIGYHDFFVRRVRPAQRVLDVGCGIGAVAHDLAERAQANVVGIDLDGNHISEARQRFSHPKVQYVHGDVLKNVPPGPFQVIILSNVLEHLQDRPTFLRRLTSVVGPERILIRVPLFERDWRVPLKPEFGVESRLDPTHETECAQESFAQEIQEAGLLITHQEIRWGEIWAETIPRPLRGKAPS